ncbi:DUF1707 domain-containing protein [Actinoplanes sp. NPDC049316]|uniref:DUF1707 SHOCT-like domain-containing protein n=1 Tax=Actinoplanes sp. NPDC049316 TaxID=3154727 RepID=UPI00343D6F78
MRAGDADRQAVAEQLRVALEEGRLDLHEYDERLQRAYAAKTYGELDGLLSDLPAAAVPAPRGAAGEPPLVTASNGELTRRWLAEVWGSWVSVVGITSAVWAVSSVTGGDLLYFWPVWVAVPWGLILMFVTVSGLVGGEPRRRAEKQARKRRAKELKQHRRVLEAEAVARGELPPPMRRRKAKKTG